MSLILIAADAGGSAHGIARAARDSGFETRHVSSCREALAVLSVGDPPLALVDLEARGFDGLELVARARSRRPEVRIVALAVDPVGPTALEALRIGADEVAGTTAAAEALERAQPRRGSARPASRFNGSSDAVVALRRRVRVAARHDAPVLLQGARGMGKSLAAAEIHRLSARADGPFVHVGREGGADGAAADAGSSVARWFDRAAGGVLFLDDVEALPAPWAQAVARRLDDDARGNGDARGARVIGAWHRPTYAGASPLADAPDLLRLLDDERVPVPDLLERRADLGDLARAFLPRGHPGLAPDGLELLASGLLARSVRELRELLAEAGRRAPDRALGTAELHPEGRGPTADLPPTEVPYFMIPATRNPKTLREVGNVYLLWTLERCRGNRSRAARHLGIDRSTLRRKLADLT